MKKTILRVILLFILGSTALPTQAQTTLATDAEQRLIAEVSGDMCRHLETENKRHPLAKLSSADAEQVFTRLLTQAAMSNDKLAARFTSIGERGARAEGEQLGRRVALTLMRECPLGQQLFMRMGGEQVKQLRPEETTVLQPIATAMCRDLTPRIAELQQLPLAQRMEVLRQTFTENIKPAAKKLNQLYGDDIFLNQEGMKELGAKISFLMALQCPEVLALFADLATGTR